MYACVRVTRRLQRASLLLMTLAPVVRLWLCLLQLGYTPLHYAARRDRLPAAKLLLEHGAPIDAQAQITYFRPGSTPFHLAFLRQSTLLITLLLSRGANPLLPKPDRKAVPCSQTQPDTTGLTQAMARNWHRNHTWSLSDSDRLEYGGQAAYCDVLQLCMLRLLVDMDDDGSYPSKASVMCLKWMNVIALTEL
eukprot:TRINITY_DN12096_c0_g8_i1.p3 TRINITY_DN12096_c0_g8~~TRINITY_DN12096_c0_g8_i1.p3  ORF type:complete len:193 (+),score=18.31 TRINITY_DN12096_c0_g8_i1:3403-3981(+)